MLNRIGIPLAKKARLENKKQFIKDLTLEFEREAVTLLQLSRPETVEHIYDLHQDEKQLSRFTMKRGSADLPKR